MKDFVFRMRVAEAITQMRDRQADFEDQPEHELAQRLVKALKLMRSEDKYQERMKKNLEEIPIC